MHNPSRYPRTYHLVGSRLQPGETDRAQVSVKDLYSKGGLLTFEEKVDGSFCRIFFDNGRLALWGRSGALGGGRHDRQFDLLKSFLAENEDTIYLVLGERYILCADWLFAKHTCFYDALPSYLLEYDLLDRETGNYLSTSARRIVLDGSPFVSAPVLFQGWPAKDVDIPKLIRPSLFKSAYWREALQEATAAAGISHDQVVAQTYMSDEPEGLYVKHEVGDQVVGRYKWVAPGFLAAILDSGTHWADRPVLRNVLRPGAEILEFPRIQF